MFKVRASGLEVEADAGEDGGEAAAGEASMGWRAKPRRAARLGGAGGVGFACDLHFGCVGIWRVRLPCGAEISGATWGVGVWTAAGAANVSPAGRRWIKFLPMQLFWGTNSARYLISLTA